METKKDLKGFVRFLFGEREIDPTKVSEKSWRWKPLGETEKGEKAAKTQ